MPTPIGTRSSLARDGIVAGTSWEDFTKQFQNVYTQGASGDTSFGEAGGSLMQPGQGYGTANIGQLGGNVARWSGNGTDVYRQLLADGTENQYSRGANGELVSANRTTNSDGWWDSTGLPLVASLAFGGATGFANAAGIGVDAAGNAIGAGTAGLANGAANAGTYAGDGAALSYAPVGDTAGSFMNVAAPAAETAAENVATQPGWWDSLTNGFSGLSSAYGNLDPLTKLGLGTAASSGLSALSGGSGGDDSSSGGGSFLNALTGGNGTTGVGSTPADYGVGTFGSNIISGLNGATATGSFNSLINGLGSTNSLDFSGLGTYDNGASPYAQPGSSGNWLSNLLSGVKDATGLTGSQLLNGGLSLGNALLGSSAAKTAAQQQTDAINNATALNTKIYGDSVTRNQPYLTAGNNALTQETNLLGQNGADAQKAAFGQFQTSPGYQFRLDQGNKAVQSSAAAAGGLYSGRAAKDLATFSQGTASNEYGNYENSLKNLINVGQNSANLQGQLGANYGNTSANLLTAGGIAQSAGTMGGTNAITNALTQFLKNQQQNGYYGT